MFDYRSDTDYSGNTPARVVPNSEYATTSHPSDSHVAIVGATTTDHVYLDTYTVIKTVANVTYVKTPLVKSMADILSFAAKGHFFGWGHCQYLDPCPGGSKVGQACNYKPAPYDTVHRGYCYESASGDLSCGRMWATNNVYFQDYKKLVETTEFDTATSPPYTAKPHRCERGTPHHTGGHDPNALSPTPRLLAAGCMVTGDASYDPLAEVHVPAYCSQPVDYMKGCMFPGAVNHDPTAKQPGKCLYLLSGCTSSTALNYNSEAAIDDGSCVEPVYGCTIRGSETTPTTAYYGVAANTPAFQSLYFGSAARSVGEVAWPTYSSVLNYDSNANVLHNCVLAVEGCMDSTAMNYDPDANVNSNVWCIPAIKGCMMPTRGHGALEYDKAAVDNRNNYRDGLAHNFNAAATIHVPSMCIIERYGCPDSTAINYDPLATVRYNVNGYDLCRPRQVGCMNRLASNFNCSLPIAQTSGSCTDVFPKISLHSSEVCVWWSSPPPSPPPPSFPPRTSFNTVTQVEVTIFVSNAPGDVDTVRLTIDVATLTSKSTSDVSITISLGSTKIQIAVKTNSISETTSQLQTKFSDEVTATQFTGLDVQKTPELKTLVTKEFLGVPPSPPADPDNIAAIIGGTLGGFLLFLLALAAYAMHMKRQGIKVDA